MMMMEVQKESSGYSKPVHQEVKSLSQIQWAIQCASAPVRGLPGLTAWVSDFGIRSERNLRSLILPRQELATRTLLVEACHWGESV